MFWYCMSLSGWPIYSQDPDWRSLRQRCIDIPFSISVILVIWKATGFIDWSMVCIAPCSASLGAITYLIITKWLWPRASLHFCKRVEVRCFCRNKSVSFGLITLLSPSVEYYLSIAAFRASIKCFVTRTPAICERDYRHQNFQFSAHILQIKKLNPQEVQVLNCNPCKSRTRIRDSTPTEWLLYSLLPTPRSGWILTFTNHLSCLFWWALIDSLWWSHSAKKKCGQCFSSANSHKVEDTFSGLEYNWFENTHSFRLSE